MKGFYRTFKDGLFVSYYNINRNVYRMSPQAAAWDATKLCWRVRKV